MTDSQKSKSTSDSPIDADQCAEQFVVLMSQHERQINACILALVPNWADAEDIAQEAKLLMWRKFDQFDASGDFGAWGRTIARNVVRTRHRKLQGKPHVFGQAFLEAIEQEFATRMEVSDRRHDFLAECLGELKESSRNFLRQCYNSSRTMAATAASLDRSPESVYKQNERIRLKLRKCIERKMSAEGESV